MSTVNIFVLVTVFVAINIFAFSLIKRIDIPKNLRHLERIELVLFIATSLSVVADVGVDVGVDVDQLLGVEQIFALITQVLQQIKKFVDIVVVVVAAASLRRKPPRRRRCPVEKVDVDDGVVEKPLLPRFVFFGRLTQKGRRLTQKLRR